MRRNGTEMGNENWTLRQPPLANDKSSSEQDRAKKSRRIDGSTSLENCILVDDPNEAQDEVNYSAQGDTTVRELGPSTNARAKMEDMCLFGTRLTEDNLFSLRDVPIRVRKQ